MPDNVMTLLAFELQSILAGALGIPENRDAFLAESRWLTALPGIRCPTSCGILQSDPR